jgi:hypothetical protein
MASWTCAFFAGGAAFLGAGFDLLLPPPNRENADFFGSGGETVLGSTFGFDPPNKESVGRAAFGFDFTGSGLNSTFAGFDPNKESVARPLGFDFTGVADLVATTALTGFEPNRGDFFGAGAGAGVFFGAGLKNENAGAGAAFFTGAGDGAGVFFGAGLKNENAGVGAAFFTGAGARAGAGVFFGAGLKNENAGAGAGAAFFTGAGDGAGVFFGAALKKENAGAFFTGAGDGATDFTGAFFLGAGAGAAFFGAAGVGSKNDVKLNVARTASSFLGAGVAAFATVFFSFVAGFGAEAAAFTTDFVARAAAFTTGFGFGGSGFDFGVSFFSNNETKLNVGRGGDDLGVGEATFAATTCGGGDVFLATGIFFGASGIFFGAGGLTTAAAGFFSDSFLNFEKNPPKSIAGIDGVDFLGGGTTSAVLGGERGIGGASFRLTAPSLSAMSLAWFSSHSLDLARTISAACSWMSRTFAISLASLSAAALAAAMTSASRAAAAFCCSLA